MEEEIKQETPAVQEEQESKIEGIVKQLLESGASPEQVIASLENLATTGEITPEELEQGKEIIASLMQEEKADAEKMFGLEFI